MSSRSNGVTNVRLSRLITSCVKRSPSCSSSRMSWSFDRSSGHDSSSSTMLRAMSRAFAEACVKSAKNSRFWGVRRRAIAVSLVLGARAPHDCEERICRTLDDPHEERDQRPAEADDDERGAECDHGRGEDVAGVVLADDHPTDRDQHAEDEKQAA